MIALSTPIQAVMREATLTDRRAADRGEQFAALATSRLDRAYRLAGLVLDDAGEPQSAPASRMPQFGDWQSPDCPVSDDWTGISSRFVDWESAVRLTCRRSGD